MSLATFLNRIRLSPRDAEVIFDRDEPVGTATDLVLPSRRWFRRNASAAANANRVDRSTEPSENAASIS